jgi:hypothetical protein
MEIKGEKIIFGIGILPEKYLWGRSQNPVG